MNMPTSEINKQAKHLTQDQINLVPESGWYKYSLVCEHEIYSKVRINVPKSYNEHFIRCPNCQKIGQSPLNWRAIIGMEAVSDEHVSHVSDGLAFIVPKRILRTDGTDVKRDSVIPSGNPYPYTSKERGY